MRSDPGSPDRLLQIGFAFRSSKALLSAVELGLFKALNDAPLEADALVRRLGLNGRGASDFFDALVSLGLLDRDEDGRTAMFPTAPAALTRKRPHTSGACWSISTLTSTGVGSD